MNSEEEFLWCVATSAYQAEGGYNGAGQPVTNWCSAEKKGDVAVAGVTADFWNRGREDLLPLRGHVVPHARISGPQLTTAWHHGTSNLEPMMRSVGVQAPTSAPRTGATAIAAATSALGHVSTAAEPAGIGAATLEVWPFSGMSQVKI